jgi:hypothetical protein
MALNPTFKTKCKKCTLESGHQGSGFNCLNATKIYISWCLRQVTLQHYYKVRGHARLQYEWVNAIRFTPRQMEVMLHKHYETKYNPPQDIMARNPRIHSP